MSKETSGYIDFFMYEIRDKKTGRSCSVRSVKEVIEWMCDNLPVEVSKVGYEERFVSDEPVLFPEAKVMKSAPVETSRFMYYKGNEKKCPYCGKVFPIPRNCPYKSFCGAPACKQKHLIESHGGPEGYREWERTRKKKTKA